MSKKLLEKVKAALQKDPTIVTTKEQASGLIGKTADEMLALGLTKNDLKQLRNKGMALQGYTRVKYYPGEKLPDGKVVPENQIYIDKRGHRLIWLLIADSKGDVSGNETVQKVSEGQDSNSG